MSKHIIITLAVIGGIALCLLAPVAWRLVGAFAIGGGCYAWIELFKLSMIQREIDRYEQTGEPRLAHRNRLARIRNRNAAGSFQSFKEHTAFPNIS